MSKVKKEYLDVFTAKGQVLYSDSTGSTGKTSALAIGANGDVLTVIDSTNGIINWSSVYQDPLTTDGDIVVRQSGSTTRLPVGADGTVLKVQSGVPSWQVEEGESNTIINVGTVGTGLFKSKVGSDLHLYKINPGSTKLSISLIDTDRVDIDVVPANISTSTLNNDAGFISGFTGFDSDDLSEGTTNLYWTTTRFDTSFGLKKLDNLSDVNVGTPGVAQDGYLLKWDNATSQFILAAFPPDTSSQIVNDAGTTSIKTEEVANTITFNANSKRIAHLYTTGNAVSGERFDFTNDNGQAILKSANTSGSGNVDLVLMPQAGGAVKFGDTGTATMTTDAGEDILIHPGSTSSTNGATTTVSGGSTTFASGSGGNLVLQGGEGPSGNGQVILPVGYTASNVNSLVTKTYVDSGKSIHDVYVNTSSTNYTMTINQQVVVQNLSVNSLSTINLPQGSTVTTGKWFIIKDGKGNSTSYTITITPYSGDTIDGQTSYLINNSYESITILWNGSQWNVI